jgi:hypothetical protein
MDMGDILVALRMGDRGKTDEWRVGFRCAMRAEAVHVSDNVLCPMVAVCSAVLLDSYRS